MTYLQEVDKLSQKVDKLAEFRGLARLLPF